MAFKEDGFGAALRSCFRQPAIDRSRRDFKGNRQQGSLPDLVRETSLNSPQADQWPFWDGRFATVHLC
jgi:hypothetical protein